MSCNYADGLSPYENKGILGTAETFDAEETIAKKCKELADMIRQSKHTVIHTGESKCEYCKHFVLNLFLSRCGHFHSRWYTGLSWTKGCLDAGEKGREAHH